MSEELTTCIFLGVGRRGSQLAVGVGGGGWARTGDQGSAEALCLVAAQLDNIYTSVNNRIQSCSCVYRLLNIVEAAM